MKLSGLSDFAGFCGRMNSHSKVERDEGQGMKAVFAQLDHIVAAFDKIVESTSSSKFRPAHHIHKTLKRNILLYVNLLLVGIGFA